MNVKFNLKSHFITCKQEMTIYVYSMHNEKTWNTKNKNGKI